MANILENYLSVRDGTLYHIKIPSLSIGRSANVIYFDTSYQNTSLATTNLEQPFRIPKADKFVCKGISLIIPNNNFVFSFHPFFELKLYVGNVELFNAVSTEFHPNAVARDDFTSTEGTLSTTISNIYLVGKPYYKIGFTIGLEIEILKDVQFYVALENVFVPEYSSGQYPVGVILYGTFYQKIIG
jgi:hypothetical protein